MTKLQRIKEIAFGLIMTAYALLLFITPEKSFPAIVAVLSLIYTVRGISTIIYYFTMARYMTDGRSILYKGVILLDFGLLTSVLTNVPHIYVLLYLLIMHAFSGAVEILRAQEAAKYGGAWKLKMFHGIVDLLLALTCIIFIRQQSIAVIVFAVGLVYSAILRIISAFRETKLIYIQ